MLKKLYYKIFKSDQKNVLKLQNKINFFKEKYEDKIIEINNIIKNKTQLNFFHSGPLGDLIYSLPLIKKLSDSHKCNLYVNLNKKFTYDYYKHTGNGYYIDERTFKFLSPLLKTQKSLNTIKKYEDEKIDINLDLFREIPISFTFNSPRWFFAITGEHFDLNNPSLFVDDHAEIKNKIVILRSFRFRNIYINYDFLKNYNDLLYVGVEEEYQDLKKNIPNLEMYNCKDLLEMAQIIKSSKFFLGNMSVGYALSETLKVPRLLEASPETPFVQPVGNNGFDFFFQPHFEKLFKYLNDKF
tara:strand:+ start:512 stop:1405 length:894 start_codon:yes stop_codon:yes gene_type:complete